METRFVSLRVPGIGANAIRVTRDIRIGADFNIVISIAQGEVYLRELSNNRKLDDD